MECGHLARIYHSDFFIMPTKLKTCGQDAHTPIKPFVENTNGFSYFKLNVLSFRKILKFTKRKFINK